MDPDRHPDAEDLTRYEALLQMANLAVHHRSVPEMLPQLAQRLQKVTSFEVAFCALRLRKKSHAPALLGGK